MKKTAWDEGCEVGKESDDFLSLDTNPYPHGTEENDRWSLGWCYGYATQDDARLIEKCS